MDEEEDRGEQDGPPEERLTCSGCFLGASVGVDRRVETDEPVLGDYSKADEPRVPLPTASEARDAIGYVRLLETLDLTPRGQASDELAADLARRLPAN
ncbi:hypothetical protein MIU24_28730 [Streptomyces venezuelae]|uniref:hypothetical protein n=1 Tax=Streptomyces sp. B6(2022) TaxID=3404749 RepID=UPI00311DA237